MSPKIERFRQLVAQQPQNELFHFSLAQAYLAANADSAAVPHLEFCVSAKSDWMMPRILLGKLHLRAGRDDEAKPLLAAALQLAIDQNHEDPESELRTLLADLG